MNRNNALKKIYINNFLKYIKKSLFFSNKDGAILEEAYHHIGS